VMLKARSNQSKAAHMLGINRGTLRTLLKKYKMLD
jgi:DNA-binding protein Fis